MEVKLVSFDRTFLDLSWKWTNDQEMSFLIGAPSITKLQQEDWFKSLKGKIDYRIFGIELDGKPIGVSGLKRIVNNTAHVFWYIGEKSFQGKGLGTLIAQAITQKAIEEEIGILYAESKVFNFRSINLLFKEGYKIIEYQEDLDEYLVEKKI